MPQEHAEADAFFCFVQLMSEFRDNFCAQLDATGVGVKATIASLYGSPAPFGSISFPGRSWRVRRLPQSHPA